MYAIFMNSHHIHGKIYLSSIRYFVICTLAIINVTIPKLEHLKAFFKQSAISFHHSYKKSYATNND